MNNTSNTEDEYARTEDNDFDLETIQRVGCSNQDSVSSMWRRLIQTKVEFHSNSKSHLSSKVASALPQALMGLLIAEIKLRWKVKNVF